MKRTSRFYGFTFYALRFHVSRFTSLLDRYAFGQVARLVDIGAAVDGDFVGQDLERHSATLERLIDKKLLIKETFKGGYSLTNAGFSAMRQCS